MHHHLGTSPSTPVRQYASTPVRQYVSATLCLALLMMSASARASDAGKPPLSACTVEPTLDDPLPCAHLGEREVIGAVTWRNLGPVFHDERGAILDEHVRLIHAEVPPDLPPVGDATFQTSIRVDDRGVWIVDAIDVEAAESLLDEVATRNRPLEDRTTSFEMIEESIKDVIIPTVWQSSEFGVNTCPFTNAWLTWTGDNRTIVSAPFNNRQSAMVRITSPYGGSCSGVMLDDEYVLTAGHCVSATAAPGPCPADPADFPTVTLAETNQQRATNFCQIPLGSWSFGERDVALLKLEAPFSTSHGFMRLSNASNTTLEAEAAMVLGFPTRINTNTVCTATSAMIHSPPANVLDVTTDIFGGGAVKTENDNSGGQSGGPIYYCPSNASNTCAPQNWTHVFGVTSGIVATGPLNAYNIGAKVPGYVHDYFHVIAPTLP